ncbi:MULTISPECIES: AzlD domain-containing protein [Roseomonadaceae]|uniref:AzlD domain-containing protein n=1 Tax=Falsiroseomonas oleicola TaxID=2801474 RepID=A0ABS6H3M7_9PROT|nr:AzlD domain-containing protein [Roseomonas oleicola]MBU8543277.1 AzlD domain-containing protein [Roseomonas oleicola]
MSQPDLALLLTVLVGLALRGLGLLLGGALRPDHPAIAWASAVSVATLAAFVTLAIAAPAGLLATVPLAARLVGLAAGGLAYWRLRGRLLPAMAAGLAALLLARLLTG